MPPSAQMATVQTPPRPGRPGPKPLTAEGSSSCPESGSSAGEQTSDSFIHLPPGAQLPNPPEQRLQFPLLSLADPPAPPKRLSRSPPKHYSSGASKSQQNTSAQDANAKQRSPPAPSSWAVHFRGFVKAVKWTKSTPQIKNTAPDREPVSGQSRDHTLSPIGGETTASMSRASRSFAASPLGHVLDRRARSTSNISPNAGGVFLVPHIRTQHELRPPTPGWMHPLPIHPYELSSAQTSLGHESGPSRQSLDQGLYSSSPPLADLPVRKSVSEIGHGSVAFAPLSPDASMSSLDHLPHFNLESPDPSQEFFPRHSVAFADENGALEPEDQEDLPIQPKGRFNGLKRALTFGRSNENRSMSDIPSSSPMPTVSRHRPSQSADTGIPGLIHATPTRDREGPSRLRRRSTVADATHSNVPSSFRLKDPPKFTLNPDASASSIISTGQSPSPTATSNKPQLRRRLTKRKPSQSSRSNLPTTIEVETPKSVEVPNPMEALVIPGAIRYPAHIGVNLTTQSLDLPRSAPPAVGRVAPPVHEQPTSTVPPVPPLPPSLTSMNTVLPSAKPLALVDPSIPSPPPLPNVKLLRPPMPQRPSLERRASRRRWTLDVASEDIDDDVLKAELERLRNLGDPSKDLTIPDESWTLARRALLSSREIILTERTYLNQLLRFMGHAALSESKPPSLLMKHLPVLLSASQAFCMRLNEDPSAWGVSAAFVTVEAVLERVLVDYCTVVGQIMLACKQTTTTPTSGTKTPTGSTSPKSPLSKSRTSIVNASELGRIFSNRSAEKVGEDKDQQRMPVSAWQGDPTTNGGRSFPRSKSMPGKSSKRHSSIPSPSAQDGNDVGTNSNGSNPLGFTPGQSPTTDSKMTSLANGRARATTAADIAIAPPQRITRYVMLYKDLLNSTPLTAPSRPLVQRALDGALRIAEKCNKAQGDLSLVMAKR